MSATFDIIGPDWVVAEMPPGYQNRVAEIQRLTADLAEMSRFARLLWVAGPDLSEAVRDAFTAMRYEVEPLPVAPGLAVKLESRRRLLLYPAASVDTIQKKSTELAQVFQILHEVADETDRVMLVTNPHASRHPSQREAALTPEALAFLGRMGVVHLPASVVFALWKLSLTDRERVRAQVDRLHAHADGTFAIPASLLV